LVRRAQEAFERGVTGLEVKKLATLFITHLHSDHTVGLPDIIFSPWVLGREEPLNVIGPLGTKHLVDHVVTAYGEDIAARTCGLEPINTTGGSATATEISAGVCYRDDHITVEAFGVEHGETWEPFGFKFTTNDKVIVVSGDTAPFESAYELWQGCDVLVHEVYCAAAFERRPSHWQKYHSHMHTSGIELGIIAAKVKPKKLVLTHLLLWGSTPEELVAEVRQNFDGEIHCGVDLGVY
jgi:ribonuclease BN (tRNA processing enzyme)